MCQQRDQIAESLFFFFFLLFWATTAAPFIHSRHLLSHKKLRDLEKSLSFFVTSNGFGFKENRFVHESIFCRYVTTEVAQIQFYLHFLRKSIRLLPLIKVFHLLSDLNETCTKCISTIEVSFP